MRAVEQTGLTFTRAQFLRAAGMFGVVAGSGGLLAALPKVALYPLFLFAFGLGISAQAWFAMFFGVFPIIIFTMSGTRGVSQVLIKVSRSLRLSRTQLFRYVVFPAILPSLAAGLRLGFGVTFLGVILSQMFAAKSGFGFILVQSVELNDKPRI